MGQQRRQGKAAWVGTSAAAAAPAGKPRQLPSHAQALPPRAQALPHTALPTAPSHVVCRVFQVAAAAGSEAGRGARQSLHAHKQQRADEERGAQGSWAVT